MAWPPPATPAPALRKSTVLGIALGTFACGALAATAVDRMRPHARFDIVHTAPAAAATPTTSPSTKDQVVAKPVTVTTAQPATAPAPLAAAGPIVQQLPPPAPEPLPALAAPVADTTPSATRPAPVKVTRVRATTPLATATTPPATKGRAAAVEPPPLSSGDVTFPAPAPSVKNSAKKTGVTPPTPGKWIDPFAD